MNPIVKNILGVILGCVIGGIVNMGLIQLGYIINPLEGVDTSDMDALAEAMKDFNIGNLIFPFLAHALGTLVGALIAALVAANHKLKFALGIGVFFLIGGIAAAVMLPAPVWFIVLDLLLAYIPMAWLGYKLASRIQK